jgi:hypothetical protein
MTEEELKERITNEAHSIYTAAMESKDPEAIRQAKTAEIMFVAGGFFALQIQKTETK